jgi:hypothetical protein
MHCKRNIPGTMMVLVMLDEGDKRDYKMQKDNKKGRKGRRRAASVFNTCVLQVPVFRKGWTDQVRRKDQQ